MFQPQAVQIEWHKDNRVYIRTAMPFGTRLNLKPFEVFEVHFPTHGCAHSSLGELWAEDSRLKVLSKLRLQVLAPCRWRLLARASRPPEDKISFCEQHFIFTNLTPYRSYICR
jgi:hypothetical protein